MILGLQTSRYADEGRVRQGSGSNFSRSRSKAAVRCVGDPGRDDRPPDTVKSCAVTLVLLYCAGGRIGATLWAWEKTFSGSYFDLMRRSLG